MNSAKLRCPSYIGIALLSLLICAPRSIPAAARESKGPHIVMIIRHAEKPDETGPEKNPNLTEKGYERADALAKIIPAHFPKPDYLFATKKSKGSNRPAETITPLSKALTEPIESTFRDEEISALATKILTDPKFEDKTVLIAWHHGKIPDLARALGVTDAPTKWDSNVFDRVWEITYQDGKATLQDLPQKALPGDAQQ